MKKMNGIFLYRSVGLLCSLETKLLSLCIRHWYEIYIGIGMFISCPVFVLRFHVNHHWPGCAKATVWRFANTHWESHFSAEKSRGSHGIWAKHFSQVHSFFKHGIDFDILLCQCWSISVNCGVIIQHYYIYAGKVLWENVRRYAAEAGKPPLPTGNCEKELYTHDFKWYSLN